MEEIYVLIAEKRTLLLVGECLSYQKTMRICWNILGICFPFFSNVWYLSVTAGINIANSDDKENDTCDETTW